MKLDNKGLLVFAMTAALLVAAFLAGADDWIVAGLMGALFGESMPTPMNGGAS
jgi:hypothetical protein